MAKLKSNVALDDPAKYDKAVAEIKAKCKCGHTSVMPVFVDSKICSYCGSIIKNNSRGFFKYRLRKMRGKNK